MTTTDNHTGVRVFLAILLVGAGLMLSAPSASAAGVVWHIGSLSNSTISQPTTTVTTSVAGSASPAAGEVQLVRIDAGSGQFRLSFEGEETTDIAVGAPSFLVQSALEALPSLGPGNVLVTAGPTFFAPGVRPYRITFAGSLAAQDVPEIIPSEGSAPLRAVIEYFIEYRTTGGDSDGSTITTNIQLPPGISAVSLQSELFFDCTSVAGASSITCTGNQVLHSPDQRRIFLKAALDPAAEPGESLTAAFEVEGGGAEFPDRTVDPIRVAAAPTFGFDAFDGIVADAAGQSFTQAGAHPDSQSVAFDLNTARDPGPVVGERDPVDDVKRVSVELPPGFAGNPTSADTCTASDLANSTSTAAEPLCSAESQIGVATVRSSGKVSLSFSWGPISLFNMVPPPGSPARLGFNVLGTVVLLDVNLRSDGDYGLTVRSGNTPQALAIAGTTVTLWGVPSDPKHKSERSCPGEVLPWNSQAPTCDSDAPPQPFFRNPTSCTDEGLETRIRANSWQHPGTFAEASYRSHEAPGFPLSPEPSTFPAGYPGPTEWGEEVGIDGCDSVPFEPTLSVQPTTNAADSPSGLEFDLSIPQGCWDAAATPEEALAPICQSDLEGVKLELPAGLAINPSSAQGLGACSSEQIGLITPVGQPQAIHFDKDPDACPDSAKIGTVAIDTPLLDEDVEGSVYLAKQLDNPFGSMLAIYPVAKANGVLLKLAGEISPQADGRLVTTFSDQPQLPFSHLHVDLFGGPRAALRTPSACGTYTSEAKLTPWARPGEPVTRSSSFAISEGCGGGFDPKLAAGTENPLAASHSPFNLQLTRGDGSQELAALKIDVPPGLLGTLRGIAYCPDSALAAISTELGTGAGQEASPSCPAASQVGTVTVGAGAGSNPFYTRSGRAYLAGPYKGAPLSLAVVTPAVAGPFDFGTVLVRNALRVDPVSTQISAVSDPLPTILHGIPLDLRDVRIALDRPGFTLNPTSCEPMAIGSSIVSTQGATANPSARFQAAGCDRLAFGPKLGITLKGKHRRGGNPALSAVLRVPQFCGRSDAKKPCPNANISRVAVSLPRSEFIAQDHLADICTRVQFESEGGGGAGCPKKSVYGHAVAYTPLLEEPLRGPVYLRSNGGERELPDLVAALGGQIHVDLVGYISSNKRTGGLRTVFATPPDAAVSKFVLKMRGGDHSLLENSTNICRATHRAIVQMDGYNGRLRDFKPALRVKGCGGEKR